jgi:hypothetical protein
VNRTVNLTIHAMDAASTESRAEDIANRRRSDARWRSEPNIGRKSDSFRAGSLGAWRA